MRSYEKPLQIRTLQQEKIVNCMKTAEVEPIYKKNSIHTVHPHVA